MIVVKEPHSSDNRTAKDILIFLLIHTVDKESVTNAIEKMRFTSLRKKQRFYSYLRDNGFDIPKNYKKYQK
jgi:hypothetical protein